MKLYISAGSPFARKIRVMLLEKNAPHELEIVDLLAPSEYPGTNPVGKVPALKLDDGRVLVNSPLIADYVEGRFPQPRLIPADADARLDVTLVTFDLDPLRYERDSTKTAREYRMRIVADVALFKGADDTAMMQRRVAGDATSDFAGDLASSKNQILPKAARDLAHKIVESIVEYW